LRRFRPEDLDTFVAYRSDPEVARYQSWEVPYQLGQARQFLEELQVIHPDTPGEWFQFAVALRGTDRLIGGRVDQRPALRRPGPGMARRPLSGRRRRPSARSMRRRSLPTNRPQHSEPLVAYEGLS